jgi:L-tryptophan--pyruvate aminotransferase
MLNHSGLLQGYPVMADYLQSRLLYWAGDARTFQAEEDQLFIEIVTSPNNPCGSIREKAVWGDYGFVVHDLAYYWPQYTPIVEALDHDIMIFSLSKATGHAGLRLG